MTDDSQTAADPEVQADAVEPPGPLDRHADESPEQHRGFLLYAVQDPRKGRTGKRSKRAVARALARDESTVRYWSKRKGCQWGPRLKAAGARTAQALAMRLYRELYLTKAGRIELDVIRPLVSVSLMQSSPLVHPAQPTRSPRKTKSWVRRGCVSSDQRRWTSRTCWAMMAPCYVKTITYRQQSVSFRYLRPTAEEAWKHHRDRPKQRPRVSPHRTRPQPRHQQPQKPRPSRTRRRRLRRRLPDRARSPIINSCRATVKFSPGLTTRLGSRMS